MPSFALQSYQALCITWRPVPRLNTPTQFTTITGSLRLHTSTYAVGNNVTIALRPSVQHRLLGHMKAGPKSWLYCSCQQCWINGWEENYHIHYTACLLCRPEMFHAWSLDTVLRRDGQHSEWLMGLGWVCWIEGIRPSSHTHTVQVCLKRMYSSPTKHCQCNVEGHLSPISVRKMHGSLQGLHTHTQCGTRCKTKTRHVAQNCILVFIHVH